MYIFLFVLKTKDKQIIFKDLEFGFADSDNDN